MNIIAISCRTNTGEVAEIPVRELFDAYSNGGVTASGTVPKSDGKKYIASGISVNDKGEIIFKKYDNTNAVTGIAQGIIAFDASGRLITIPLENKSVASSAANDIQSSATIASTENLLPFFLDDNGTLADTDILNDSGNYSVGGPAAFWKWDVSGSVNVSQLSKSDGFRINGKLVVSYDPATGELTIGNTVYTTTNIQHIKTETATWSAVGGGSITDIAEATAGTYSLIKPAENGTYATREWTGNNYWKLDGNALSASKGLGTTTAQDWTLIHESDTIATIKSTGLHLTNLTTNYLPKHTSGGLANSLAFDNGTNFAIGTNTNIDSYSRLYVFGGTNGANIDARGGGGGYDQGIFDAQGSDYATTFHSVHLRYQGIGATGTTFGYSNVNLADLTYNYSGSDRAFIIRSVFDNPIVLGVDNAQVARIASTGLHLSVLSNATTDTDKFLVSDSGVVKYRTGTQILSDIGGFASPSGLTTNYVTKWNGTALANSLIFDNGTNVGVGTASPSAKLHVNNGGTSGSLDYNLILQKSTVSDGDNSAVGLLFSTEGNPTGFGKGGIAFERKGGWGIGSMHFLNSSSAGTTNPTLSDSKITILSSGNVGLSTLSPGSTLDIAGYGSNTIDNTKGIRFGDSNAGITPWNFNTGGSGNYRSLTFYATGYDGASIVTRNIMTIGDYVMGVGIGTTTPSELLHVNGTSRTTNLKITNGATVGYAWKCTNLDGTGAWESVATSERWKGTWDASSGSAPSGSPTTGDYYTVTTAGTYSGVTYAVNDYSYYNGTSWVYRPNGYTLTTATSSVLGGIKIGSNLAIDGSGVVTVTSSPILTTTRNIAITGDIAWNVDFNGSGNVTAAGTLATVNSNVGTFRSVTVNAKGLVTAATNPTTLAGYGITDAQATLVSGTNIKTVATYSLLGSGDISIASLNYWTKTGSDVSFVGGNVYAPYFEANGAIAAVATSGTDNYTVLGVGSTVFQQKVYDVTNPRLETISSSGVLGTIFNGGNYRFGTGADSTLAKVQVVGAIQQSSVTSSYIKANASGVLIAGTITTSDISNLSSYTGFDARYFTEAEIIAGFQPLDADLTAIAEISTTSGLLKKTAANTWSLDTSTYLTSVNLTTNVTGVLPIANGGTGTSVQNFVDLYTPQNVGGLKNFTEGGVFGLLSISDVSYSAGSGTTIAASELNSADLVVVDSTKFAFYNGTTLRASFSSSGLLIGAASHDSLNASSTSSERLQVNGNIRYRNLLKPNNVAGTNGQVLGTNGTQDAWTTLTVSHISDIASTYQTILSGTGIVKSTSGTISYLTDNSSNWDTAYGWGNHASGGYLTTSVAASTYQPLLPSGTAGQFLVKDSLGNNNFMNLELLPQGLTHKRIAVGDSQHYLSEELNFEYRESRFIAINRFTDPLKYLGVGMYGNSNNSFIEAVGGTLTVRGDNGLIFSNFVGGGTLALTVDNDGRVGVTSISGGGSGTTSLTNSYIGYGSSTNTVVGNSKFTFTDGRIITINNGATSRVEVGRKISTENYGMYVTGGNLELYTATGQAVDFLSNDIYFNTPAGVTKGGIQIDTNLYVVSSGVELNVVGDTALRLLSNSGEVTLGNSGTDSLVTIAGTEFKLHLDDSFAGAYTPANGDNCVLHYSTAKGAFILRKANTYNDGTRTYLIQ